MVRKFRRHALGTYTYRFDSYLFDVFLGPNYNQSPPSVKYMTVGQVGWSRQPVRLTMSTQTNGGKFRFNPNLYAVS